MSNGWTPERRQKQSEAIHRWKPWEQAYPKTGPKTDEGKARSSQNAFKHGGYSGETKALRGILAALAI